MHQIIYYYVYIHVVCLLKGTSTIHSVYKLALLHSFNRYNPELKTGSCSFYAEASKEFKWSNDGWQVFYKHKAFRSCVDKGCKFCNELEVCLKCVEGDLHWDEKNERPVCNHDVTTPSWMLQQYQFGMPQHETEAMHIVPEIN